MSTVAVSASKLNPAGNHGCFSFTLPFWTTIVAFTAFILASPSALAQNWDTNGWVFGGSASWFFQSNVTLNGGEALQSGVIADGQETYAETQVFGPAVLRFHWKISSQTTWDDLRFETNGIQSGGSISGELDWQQRVFYFPSNTNSVRWVYRKRAGGSAGADAAWLDAVSIRPPEEPIVLRQPANTSVLQCGYLLLSAGLVGAEPMAFQWQFNEADIPDATNTTLLITNFQDAHVGNYRLIASNSFGVATTATAVATLRPLVQSAAMELLWSKPVNSTSWLAEDTDNSFRWRGLAYNRTTGRLLVASRAGGTNIWVLDGQTGAELHTLNLTGVLLEERFPLNLVRVADDGAVYACNLRVSSDSTNRTRIYKWADDSASTFPVLVWEGEPAPPAFPALSWGDSMDVRGSGSDTELIFAHFMAFSTLKVSIITPALGVNSSPTVITLAGIYGPSGPSFIAFGEGDTFWVKPAGFNLRYYSFSGTNATLLASHSLPSLAGMDVAASEWKLAAITTDAPDCLRFYDLVSLTNGVSWADTEFFRYPVDLANPFSAGSVDVTSDRIYALDANNGILALKFAPMLRLTRNPDTTITLTWSGGTLQSATNITGPFDDEIVSSPYTLTPASPQRFFRIRN